MRSTAPWLHPAGTTIELTAAGESWDAVRVPIRYARGMLDRLGREGGAVIEDLYSQCLYWLVRPGSADGWGLSPLYVTILGSPPTWRSRPWAAPRVTAFNGQCRRRPRAT
ncbi:hypothetical protein [Streptomyces niveus]|uniref:hypothetical protein n=1 Tax=Streptomyces niveus TaxID=193462 RepID=UPI00114CEB63|nr:hypothetical protein [Streptomyces niveus]